MVADAFQQEAVFGAARIVCNDDPPTVCNEHTSQRRNRRAVALRTLRPGDIVASVPALAALPHRDLGSTRCSFCLSVAKNASTEGDKLLRCGRCRAAFYCGGQCQKADWRKNHKVECSVASTLNDALRREGLEGAGASSDALLAGRCLRHSTDGKREESGALEDLKLLGEHLEDGQGERLRRLASVVATVPKLLPVGSSAEDALITLRRFQNNNFAVLDDLFMSVGAGVFPNGASLNHSCAPNCLLTYSLQRGCPPEQVVRAMTHIPQGAELTHSYVELAFPSWQRQRLLRKTYGFDCTCTACVNGRGELDAFLVGSATCTGAVVSEESGCPLPRAPHCDERDRDLAKADQVVKAATAEEDPERELGLLKSACKLRERWLHRRHTEVIAVHALAHTAAIAAGAWQEAEIYCERLVEHYMEVYPTWHPISGLQMYTLAELKEKRGCSDARTWYKRALDILVLTHGSQHDMVEDLRQHLADLDK
eukprot:TRINITY_DN61877_c0_g1_i1.p1 TRINITY_DN61877_c0_g1~~TRINITY_DN61877_c0_g1_i1.p1  ORF type:complete len:482 (-),score=86.48 TRINITY_DN61877_c0_g1_i1:172-1617(-)